jgi:methionyl-tRNA formyltransferase
MRSVTILCTDPQHPIQPWLTQWMESQAGFANVRIVHRSDEALGGDLLFLVSCHEIIREPVRRRYVHTLVLHASDLPHGKGMSPHVWQILEGKTEITVTLLEAVDELDAGDIWHQVQLPIPRTALHDDIHSLLFDAELHLMTWALEHMSTVRTRPQSGVSTRYRRRTPEDSRVELSSTLGEAFNQLRVADPNRYPAFLEVDGVRFKILLQRM